MIRFATVSAGMLLASVPAIASTPAAWATMHRAAQKACIAASGLRAPEASAPLDFSDASAKSAVLVRGVYPQRFMKGARGTFLCLYDRRTKTAEALEAPGFALAPKR